MDWAGTAEQGDAERAAERAAAALGAAMEEEEAGAYTRPLLSST